MEFGPRDILYIIGIIVTAVVTFLSTKHSLKDLIRDKNEALTQKINDMKVEMERINGKQNLQQQIIEQFQSQVLTHLPDLFAIIKEKKNGNSTRK